MRFADPTHCIATFDELRAVLQAFYRPLASEELLELAKRLRIPAQQWRDRVAFDPQQFCFQTLYESPHFEINLIGWHSGQHSTVHDHRGTACCVLVLDGVLTNRDYHTGSGDALTEIARFDLNQGEILSRSGSQIHRCGNEHPGGSDLVTLHLYSPPLRPLAARQYRG